MINKFGLFGIIVIVLASISMTYVWADPEISPGQWEITSTTKMAGMPTQSVTSVQCIKLGDPIPMLSADSHDCQIKNRKINGNTISWNIICDGQGGRTNGSGQITYNGDTMKGTMIMTIAGANLKITNNLSGRRIGGCPR